MKQGTTALVATAILLAGTAALMAQPLPPMDGPPVDYDTGAYYRGRIAPPPPVYAPEELAMPAYEAAAIMRSRGFLPLSGPVRRGGFYVVSAIHRSGDEGRLVIDAYTGRIVDFAPASDVIRASRNDEMVLIYQGPRFPPPNAARAAIPAPATRGVPRPPAPVPRVASRVPPSSPLATPKPRPQAAPKKPETAQAPPVPAPVESKPAAASPPLENAPSKPVVQPTQPLPPVQTME